MTYPAVLFEKNNVTPSCLINKTNVVFIATTDDPADSLAYHFEIAKNKAYANCKVVPAFRPDKAMGAERPGYPGYVGSLGEAAGAGIKSFRGLISALESRLLAFKAAGSMLNDNGLTGFEWSDYSEAQIERIFDKAMDPASADMGAQLSRDETNKSRSAFFYATALLYAKHGFTAKSHTGAYRNANSAMFARLGPDTGFDGVDEASSVRAFGTLLDRLNSAGGLPRAIFYPLDINQYEAFAALASNFNGRGEGWVQLGAPWWFNDQYYGIYKQFESAGSLYPVALSAGMLTDSRSFLSYPRHELYRRALCSYLGAVADRGEYFAGEEALGEVIYGICYGNAKKYFGL